jgi:hypothetical protein
MVWVAYHAWQRGFSLYVCMFIHWVLFLFTLPTCSCFFHISCSHLPCSHMHYNCFCFKSSVLCAHPSWHQASEWGLSNNWSMSLALHAWPGVPSYDLSSITSSPSTSSNSQHILFSPSLMAHLIVEWLCCASKRMIILWSIRQHLTQWRVIWRSLWFCIGWWSSLRDWKCPFKAVNTCSTWTQI